MKFCILAVCVAGLIACEPAKCACDASDPALKESVSQQKTDCQKAAEKLAELHCKESRPDFVDFCLSSLDAGVPLRPVCLSMITDCKEVDSVCR